MLYFLLPSVLGKRERDRGYSTRIHKASHMVFIYKVVGVYIFVVLGVIVTEKKK